MRNTSTDSTNFRRPMMLALVVGLVAAVLGIVGLFVSGPSLFFQAYLFAFLFCLALSLGSLGLLMTHFALGTRWGLTIRRIAEAGAGSIWVTAILFIPILLGLGNIYPWVNPAGLQLNEEATHMLEGKAFYLNVPFFILRAVIYFAIWIALAYFVNRLSARYAATAPRAGDVGDLAMRGRLLSLGAFGLILYFLTMTFASVDWIMSLQPLWTSTAFGLIVIVGQVLTALSFAVVVLNLFPGLSLGRRWNYEKTPLPYADLGSLLLVFVIGWTYLSYFQLLIIWGGNIPREVVWYINRTQGGWNILPIIIAIFQFTLPFLMLLSARIRHSLRALALLGGLLLLTNLINIFWHVKPAFAPAGLSISWLDIVVPLALLGLWLAGFFFNLARRPAISPNEATALELTGNEVVH